MSHRLMKHELTVKNILTVIADFLRYTFTPALSLVLLVCGLGAFAIMTILFYRFEPLLAVLIFCSYAGFLLMAMVASFKRWKRYKDHYEKVFKK